MRIVVAPDSFKGSLPAAEVADSLFRGIERALPDADIVSHPLADGGEGTLDVVLARGYRAREVSILDHLGRERTAHYASQGTIAVVESARACPFTPGASAEHALRATSRGVGQLIRHALESGATQVILTVGGTASTDGGAGMLEELGVRLVDVHGQPIPDGGAGLVELAAVDASSLHPLIAPASIRVLTDVESPLTGPAGAARVFAPQKGADEAALDTLERGLARIAEVSGSVAAAQPGAGAGGGIGFAALAYLGATQHSGAEAVMELTGFDQALAGADLVVTGEGSFDDQSAAGKAPALVVQRAQERGVPVVVVCGLDRRSSPGGLDVIALSAYEPDPERSIRGAAGLLQRAGEEIGRRLRG